MDITRGYYGVSIHRKEQWDLDCIPFVCVHLRLPNSSTRIFCVWRWGIQIRPFMLTRRCIRFGRWFHRFS